MSVLKSFLLGGSGIASVDSILADLPLEVATRRVDGLPYSIYDLVWHIELTQNVLLTALAEDDASEVRFPPREEQWPSSRPSEEEWEDLVSGVRAGLYEASELASSPEALPERDREVLEDIAAHNAYHWGQVVVLRRLLGVWNTQAGVDA
ncbi:DinB family protein [Deinococcus pimensis]|uniref:DinB family protein n=1 Tax=Deinococcus pimensis TaxID=309888 RepID=UPI00048076D0|nr:DinB family protein [Deinococcus pimensis]